MTRLKEYALHSLVWLSRFRYRRGWGIHSPFAYRFVHEVVFPDGNFAEYRTLADMRRSNGVTTWPRYDRLFLRLAHFAKPGNVVVFGRNAHIVSRYISCGHKPETMCSHNNNLNETLRSIEAMPSVDMLYVNDAAAAERLYNAAIGRVQPESMMVIRGIGHDDALRRLWKRIEADDRTVITFDLYYLGIVMFRRGMSKEAFKVCF